MSSTEAEQYKQDILSVTGRCDRLQARVRELERIINDHADVAGCHDETGDAEYNAYNFGWRCCAESMRAALAGKGDGDE